MQHKELVNTFSDYYYYFFIFPESLYSLRPYDIQYELNSQVK